jgi:predicted rRNA methylase YqxC with S4 and FtsJ domains
VALLKPQFEAGRVEADRGGGVITDPEVHLRVLRDLLAWLKEWPERAPDAPFLTPQTLIGSPIAGREGNREYLMKLIAHEASDVNLSQGLFDDAALRRIIEETFAPTSVAED